jgi:hypothetical protein
LRLAQDHPDKYHDLPAENLEAAWQKLEVSEAYDALSALGQHYPAWVESVEKSLCALRSNYAEVAAALGGVHEAASGLLKDIEADTRYYEKAVRTRCLVRLQWLTRVTSSKAAWSSRSSRGKLWLTSTKPWALHTTLRTFSESGARSRR